ncbi:conserved hypothetical protein [Talaromyces stipitatus ATCC 10500]|uniref:Leucine rich repeat protein n=1 Tax=Talaromyces stipitatus (strain ATCC 10500 / CBS 375.48 / QM 6759 / NRRL 1006) TaxID=441959 RepID=B8MAJ1_TALSN|nr:uncharacterized protein TSTA_112490 [Talaromyces stipitatus ATCC 10500]EED17415.1 conserved hypothetical protein [Talaromyces stipitatus ATCC 10500]
MVRLNYTSRKISGVKAGLAVKKDLNKRIPSTPNFRVRDPVLEIDISGKELTDDGFNEFILDLRIALQSASPEYPQGINKLQELHLKGNQLTVNALVELAKIIQLSSRDLKELDVSNNDISIITISDAQKWKYFLQSFSQCCVLKKIDFSGNSLGARGIEILARVYIRSELDFVETVVDSEEDEHLNDLELEETTQRGEHAVVSQATKEVSRRSQTSPSKAHTYTDAEFRRYACTRGLRSVPYLILQDVSMTNGAIIHLAEMIRMHRTPETLLPFLPGGKPLNLPPSEYGAGGIYWLPNDGISELSVRLMKLMEQMQRSIAENESDDELAVDFDEFNFDDLDHEEMERNQEERERRRRHRQALTVNLGRATSQQRIHTLGTEGLRKSVLWHCALRMLAVSRAILLDFTSRPTPVEEELAASKKSRLEQLRRQDATRSSLPVDKRHASPKLNDQLLTGISSQERPLSSSPRCLSTRTVVDGWSTKFDDIPRGALISSLRFDPKSSTFDHMFPAMHHTPENPLLQVNPPPVAAAMPNYPCIIESEHDIKASGHVLKGGKSDTKKDGGVHPSSSSPTTLSCGGKIATTTGNYRSKYQFGLPLHLWRRIIAEAMGVNGILHPDQQMKIVSYAASWGALEAEMSINGAAEHQQLWKILDSIDCFTYKPLS